MVEIPIRDGRSELLVDGEPVDAGDGKNHELPQHQYNLQSWRHPNRQLMAYFAADGMSDDDMNDGARAVLGGEPER